MTAAATATDIPALVLATGPQAGARLSLAVGCHLLGRGGYAAIQLDAPGVSRRHAEILVERDGSCAIRDLHSTNGTLLNGIPLGEQAQPLRPGDHIHLGRAVVLRVLEPSSSLAEADGEASFDPITGIYDRRCLAARAERAVARARRGGMPVALCLLDIEQLASINAEHGADVGDEALRQLALHLQIAETPGELLARFEDDMFVLLVPGERAARLASRVQRALHGLRVTRRDGTAVLVRVSAGVSGVDPGDPTSAVDLFLAAARRLRRAKQDQPGSICLED